VQTVNANLNLALYGQIENLIGGAGNDALTGHNANNILTGGPGNDTLTGGAGNDTYVFGDGCGNDTIVEAADGGNDTLDFSPGTSGLTVTINGSLAAMIENIIGTPQADTFALMDGTVLAGYINGNGGSDTLDFSAYLSGQSVTLTGLGSLTGFNGSTSLLGGGFTNISYLVASAAAGDSLIGLNAVNTWALTGGTNGTYTSTRSLGFSGFETLNGGSLVDTFNLMGAVSLDLNGNAGSDTLAFGEGATLTGTFNGEAGSDTLTFAGNSTGRLITLTSLGAVDGFNGSAAGGSFQNVNILVGGNGDDNLTGLNAASQWQVTGDQAGN